MRRSHLLARAALLSLALAFAGTVFAQSDPVPVPPGTTTSTAPRSDTVAPKPETQPRSVPDTRARTDRTAPDDPDRDSRHRDLPATASPLAAMGLLGLLSLGGAATLNAFRRRF